jgi:hypothetical protein
MSDAQYQHLSDILKDSISDDEFIQAVNIFFCLNLTSSKYCFI